MTASCSISHDESRRRFLATASLISDLTLFLRGPFARMRRPERF